MKVMAKTMADFVGDILDTKQHGFKVRSMSCVFNMSDIRLKFLMGSWGNGICVACVYSGTHPVLQTQKM